MAKFVIEVEEMIRYQMEVKAETAQEAAQIAEDKFFETNHDDRYHQWGYAIQTEFDDAELVDEEA